MYNRSPADLYPLARLCRAYVPFVLFVPFVSPLAVLFISDICYFEHFSDIINLLETPVFCATLLSDKRTKHVP